MIYITGDTHGEQARLLYPAAGELKPEDALIVCGDFGFLFRDDAEENDFLDRLEQMPGTYCFVDGNHEDFNAIFRYPETEWNGFLEYLMYEMDFKKWYCGHWHVDREMTDKFRFLWFDTVCIKEV